MLRLLIALAVVLAVTGGAAWLAEHPGTVSYDWLGYSGTVSTGTALVGAVLTFAVLSVVLEGLRGLWRLPRRLLRLRTERRRARGLRALSDGWLALASGDRRAAARHAEIARRRLSGEPALTLLSAQAAQLGGAPELAARRFAELADDPSTALVGLRGLMVEAERRGDVAAWQDSALRAYAIAPKLGWTGRSALAASVAARDYATALRVLSRMSAGSAGERRALQRRRLVLLLAQADALALSDPAAAAKAAREAHAIDRTFAPAAVAAARHLTALGEIAAADTLLQRAFARAPHPDIVRAFVGPVASSTAAHALERAEALAASRQGDIEADVAIARAALAVRDASRARSALAPHLAGTPTRRVCLLMAAVERIAHGPEALVRHWLARATVAPRDPVWIADGVAAPQWRPIDPHTGALDRYEWRTPPPIDDPDVGVVDLAALDDVAAPEAALPAPATAGERATDKAETGWTSADPQRPSVPGLPRTA